MVDAFAASGAADPRGPRALAATPQRGMSVEAIVEPYTMVGRAVGHLGNVIDEATADWHRQAGEQVEITRGPDGLPQVERSRRLLELSVGDRSYNAAVAQKALAEGQNFIQRSATDIRAKHPHDPAAYEAEMGKFVKTVGTTGDKLLRAPLQAFAENLFTQNRNAMQIEKSQVDFSNGKSALLARAQTIANDMMVIGRDGGADTDTYRLQVKNLRDVYGQLQAIPAYGFPAEKVAEDLKRWESLGAGMAAAGGVTRAWKEGGVVAGRKYIEREITNATGLHGLSDADRAHIKTFAETKLAELQGERQIAVERQKPTVEAFWQYQWGRGQKVDDGHYDDALKKAQEAGSDELVARLLNGRRLEQGFIAARGAPGAAFPGGHGSAPSGGPSAPAIGADSRERLTAAATAEPNRTVDQLLGAKDYDDHKTFFTGPDGKPLSAKAAAEKLVGATRAAGSTSDFATGAFPASLISTESGGNWAASDNVPGSGGSGHFGRLQFSRGRLQSAMDAGAIPKGTTPEAFMRSPELQQAAERWHFRDIDLFMQQEGLTKAVGTTIKGVPVTVNGMRAVAHLGGNHGLKQFIESGGGYNPSDANGTSLLDYLRKHGGSSSQAGGPPGMPGGAGPIPWTTEQLKQNPYLLPGWLAAAAGASDVQVKWAATVADALTTGAKHDQAPNIDLATAVMQIARANPTEAGLAEKVRAFSAAVGGGAIGTMAAGMTESAGASFIAEVNRRAQGADVYTQLLARDAQDSYRRRETRMKSDPVAEGADRNFHPPLPPLDMSAPPAKLAETLAAYGAAARDRGAALGNPSQSAFGPNEFAQAKAVASTGPIEQRLQLLSAISAMPEAVRNATLQQIGMGGEAAVFSYAGGLAQEAPDIARSIVMGQAAMTAQEGLIPKTGANATSYRSSKSAALPVTAFPPSMRMDGSGPLAAMSQAIDARYAYLAAQAGDTTGKPNETRLRQSVNDVTGGIVWQNGAAVIAPARGMDQRTFDGVMAGLTDADLAGVTTGNGRPITADYVRSTARLHAVGAARYLVVLNRNDEAPQYAAKDGQAFVLSLKDRQPAEVYRPRDRMDPNLP